MRTRRKCSSTQILSITTNVESVLQDPKIRLAAFERYGGKLVHDFAFGSLGNATSEPEAPCAAAFEVISLSKDWSQDKGFALLAQEVVVRATHTVRFGVNASRPAYLQPSATPEANAEPRLQASTIGYNKAEVDTLTARALERGDTFICETLGEADQGNAYLFLSWKPRDDEKYNVLHSRLRSYLFFGGHPSHRIAKSTMDALFASDSQKFDFLTGRMLTAGRRKTKTKERVRASSYSA